MPATKSNISVSGRMSANFGRAVALLLISAEILRLSTVVDSYLVCSNNCGFDRPGKFVKLAIRTSADRRVFNYRGLSPWVPQMTVGLAMRILAVDNPTAFNYTTKFYSPYGDFVSSINGISPEKHQYWKLCVNDQPAMCGLDTYRLSEADEIVWKLADVKESSNEESKC